MKLKCQNRRETEAELSDDGVMEGDPLWNKSNFGLKRLYKH